MTARALLVVLILVVVALFVAHHWLLAPRYQIAQLSNGAVVRLDVHTGAMEAFTLQMARPQYDGEAPRFIMAPYRP